MSFIKERIKEIALNKGIPIGKFFKKLDLAPSGFNGEKIKKGANSDTIEKIVSLFPDVDLHWLITGEQKIEKEKENIVMEEPDNYESGYKEKYIKMLEENRELRIENKSLLKSIDSLKKDNKQISN